MTLAVKEAPTSSGDRIGPEAIKALEHMGTDGAKSAVLSKGETETKDKSKPGVNQKPKEGLMTKCSRCTNIGTQEVENAIDQQARYLEIIATLSGAEQTLHQMGQELSDVQKCSDIGVDCRRPWDPGALYEGRESEGKNGKLAYNKSASAGGNT